MKASKNKILITGSNGFIGYSLVNFLIKKGFSLVAVVRQISSKLPKHIEQITIGDIQPNTDWSDVLSDVNVVIHLAARAHILQDSASSPLAEFRRTNTDGTINFARQAAQANVERFIFISSIGVNGNRNDKPFKMDDKPAPIEPYAISKFEAEVGLRKIEDETGMGIVIIRPPLVYGPNAPGNFGRLMAAVVKGLPLPLGAIHNQRSLVALDNLIDLITVCIDHPAAVGRLFLVSDDHDLSTTELLQHLTKIVGKPARLIPIPSKVLVISANLLGKAGMVQRLCDSLQVDISYTKKQLNWYPPLTVDAALKKVVKAQ